MKKQLVFLLVWIALPMVAQTGIGTTTPHASAKLEVASSTQGFLPPRVALTAANQASPVTSPAIGLLVFNTQTAGTAPNNVTPGYYYWNGSSWSAMPSSQTSIGDVKTGMQVNDHNGWVRLDGRLKSSLTASQQLQANVLGIGDNLPNATNAVLMQSSGTLGSVTGSMSRTLVQNQLPNISPNITINGTIATMQDAGSHEHSIRVVPNATGGYASFGAGPFAFKSGMAPTTEADADTTDRTANSSYVTTGIIGSAGTHSHSINTHTHTATSSSINGDVTQQSIDITPRSLSVNTFIYLGF
ncbi:hypothetical protein [Flavobacterium ammonificans]|uniref:Phage tail collar domain-containing protein n=1 Tax=Flavobacterium ammonificans TaxID=1751056 RepID=A0ABN6KST5_9FLAO|nr:hypothetical protein [Flavobacterium ammonificans]BDB52197.1 hypothetical protein GENT11_05090 [Flavobacterium ammonificans]